ncbi:MAG: magnesium/cobalt transporter CorA [Deltaproteobacteria bacterium]|nr:magnesium/cobalt transporter CorA [Deltaproteobacteria bacterium]
MVQQFKKRSQKAGLPPGTFVHIGDRLAKEVRMEVINYSEERLEKKEIKSIEECRPFLERPDTVTWINIEGIHDVKKIEEIGMIFGTHPLILEDILNSDQRPKMEDLGEYIYTVLKIFNEQKGESLKVVSEQISIIIGGNYVFSILEKENTVLKPIRTRLEAGIGRIRKAGPDYLAYAIIDAVVDHYFIVLEAFGEKAERMEEASLKNPGPDTLQAIQDFKREMIFLRRSVWPLRETISSLARSESPLIQDGTIAYFKDVYDHTIQVIDNIETLRDMLSGLLDIYLSSVSNKMNTVMKTLTIIATIFIPLTFIAGVYGMNFKYMPELEWPWGYFGVWGIMLVVAFLMVIFFYKKKW